MSETIQRIPGAFQRVRQLVRSVPAGRVTTYGRLARAVSETGPPLSARAAGWALSRCPPDVPWHRVVNAAGALSVERSGLCPPGFQRALLEAEGVPFDGKGRVRLAVCVFEPDPADLDLGDPAPAHQEATPCTVA